MGGEWRPCATDRGTWRSGELCRTGGCPDHFVTRLLATLAQRPGWRAGDHATRGHIYMMGSRWGTILCRRWCSDAPAGRCLCYCPGMGDEHPAPQHLDIRLNANEQVSGLLLVPDGAKACLVLAHGAGAGMSHPFMTAIAAGLHERGVASLRYQFAYMEKGSRRPDGPALAHAAVRAAVHEANLRCPALPLFAGGKSFGGRMTSQAQADAPLADVRGVVFFGFPLHPANKPSVVRARSPVRCAHSHAVPSGTARRTCGPQAHDGSRRGTWRRDNSACGFRMPTIHFMYRRGVDAAMSKCGAAFSTAWLAG